MRRLRLVIVGAAALAAIVAGTGSQALGHVQLTNLSVTVHSCANFGQGTPGCQDPQLALTVRPGERYRFRASFTLSGHRSFVSSHSFAFFNATGTRAEIPGLHGGHLGAHGTGRVVKEGATGEQLVFDVPADWAPGVYRFTYSIVERPVNNLNAPETYTGARSFLVSASQS